jgi:hypothetical protein
MEREMPTKLIKLNRNKIDRVVRKNWGKLRNQWIQQVTVGGTVADDSPGEGKAACSSFNTDRPELGRALQAVFDRDWASSYAWLLS